MPSQKDFYLQFLVHTRNNGGIHIRSNTDTIFFVCLYKISAMNVVVIDNKPYVVVPQKSYEALQKKAALKTRAENVLSVEEARAHSKKMIRKWAGK